MARPLPKLSMQNLSFLPIPVTFFFVVISIFAVFSIVTFLCASHKARNSQRRKGEATVQLGGDKKMLSKLQSNISSKALLMVKMISGRKLQDDEDDQEWDDDEALWRRTIIMGERCRPLGFSGRISYDSQGNLLPNSSH